MEIVQKDFQLKKQTENQKELKEINSNKSITLTIQDNKYFLEGNLMESIIGIKENTNLKNYINNGSTSKIQFLIFITDFLM